MDKTITIEQVMERVKNKKLEELTQQDVFDRYIVYGSETELDEPIIQKLVIDKGYAGTLIDMIDIITEKDVELALLNSDIDKDIDITLVKGCITNMTIHEEKYNENTSDYIVKIQFESIDDNTKFEFKRYFASEDLVNSFNHKIKIYQNNIIALVEGINAEPDLLCFLKTYDDIRYTFKE